MTLLVVLIPDSYDRDRGVEKSIIINYIILVRFEVLAAVSDEFYLLGCNGVSFV
jgi:hypothetical protein